MSDTGSRISPEEDPRQQGDDAPQTSGSFAETAEGFPICQWCGGAITEKADLVVAVDETGTATQIAPVGYTAPRTYAAFHRDCHAEFAEEAPSRPAADEGGFWTPINVAIVGAGALLILVVLYFALFPQ